MRDFNKEMEELLNPMKEFNEQMESITNPMKILMNSVKIPSLYSIPNLDLGIKPMEINSFTSPSYINTFQELQKQMEDTLNPLKELQDEMIYTINPLKEIQDTMEIMVNPFKNLQTTINPMKSIMDTVNSSINPFNLSQLNEALQALENSSFKIEDSVEQEIEEQIELLKDEDRQALDEIILALKHSFPQIDFISKAFSKKQYIAILTCFIIYVVPTIYKQYQKQQKMISDSYYKINRNKVRVRTAPSTENPKTIIMKLNKNVFVEKIDSHKNWIKIEFENDSGEEIEGWIRRDMVNKIEE